jgi:hypothetical protein
LESSEKRRLPGVHIKAMGEAGGFAMAVVEIARMPKRDTKRREGIAWIRISGSGFRNWEVVVGSIVRFRSDT